MLVNSRFERRCTAAEETCRNGRESMSRSDVRIGAVMRAFYTWWSTPWAGMVPRSAGDDAG